MELTQRPKPDTGQTANKASGYFEIVRELLLDLSVTDDRGQKLGLDEGAEAAAKMLLAVSLGNHKIMVVGNGGSAAIAGHVQNDLCKAVGVQAMIFNDPSLLTALANDEGYDAVYAYGVDLWAVPGDLLVAVSSSGRSENILGAAGTALARGCDVITITGFSPNNPLRSLGRLNFYVASDNYGYVETAHSCLTHFITDRAAVIRGRGEKLDAGI